MDNGFFNNKKQIGQFLFILSLLFFAVMIYLAFTKPSIGYDDYYTLGLVRYPFWDMVNATASNVHPPLYYAIVKLFVKAFAITNNEGLILIGKMVSLVPIALILLLNITKVKKEFGFLVAGIFSFLICTSSQIMYYAVVIRMYSWGLFFLTLQMVFFYDIIHNKSNKGWIIFTLASICAIYTHYFTAISSIIIYLLLFAYLLWKNKGKIKFWFISAIIAFMSYLPWIGILINQVSKVSDHYWIKPITLSNIFEYFLFIFSPSNDLIGIILGFLLFLALLALIYFALRNKKSGDDSVDFAIISASIIFLTILSGIVLSILIRPIFMSRYMLPAFGTLLLSISILLARIFDDSSIVDNKKSGYKSLASMANNKFFYMVMGLIVIISVFSTLSFISTVDLEYGVTVNQTEFLDSINDGRVVIFDTNDSCLRYGQFLDKDKLIRDSNLKTLDEYKNEDTVVFVKWNLDKLNSLGYNFNRINGFDQDEIFTYS